VGAKDEVASRRLSTVDKRLLACDCKKFEVISWSHHLSHEILLS